MDYQPIFYALLPDLIVVVTLFAALGVDYGYMRGASLKERAARTLQICSLGLLGGLVMLVLQLEGTLPLDYAELLVATHGQLMLSPGTLALKWLLFALGMAVLPLAARHMVTVHVSEYFALLLLATLGMGFMVASRNLLGAFVALELVSLSLYSLTALHQTRRTSAEAALKYLTYGGVSTAFLLFGLSYFYGMTGALDLSAVSEAVPSSPLITVAYLFILVGIGFKIAVAPFHLWAPDVYQAAPTPAAAWIASGSKIAGVGLLLSLLKPVAGQPPIVLLLAAMAVLSMSVGNLGALRQSNLKRLLAYSAIANAGYLLVGVVAFSAAGNTSVIFYILVYSLASLGAFGVVAVLTDTLGRDAEISDFNGCWKTTPGLAAAFLVFVLSLAGIPPLAGFLGKFYLFFAAIGAAPEAASWHDGFYWLVAFALIMSVVSLYYYLRVLKAFLVAPADDGAAIAPSKIGWAAGVTLCVLALAVVALGLWPEPLLGLLRN